MNIGEKFKCIPKEYRPIPFWSWNERLNVDETRNQIELMNNAGLGGYFMHARGGLQTEYMGDEWFDNITVGVAEGKKHGMGAWAYDENGWPSGFGNGLVNGKGINYQQKYLRMENGERQTEVTICNIDGVHLYYDVNPFYVDVLDDKVAKSFINEIYLPYYEKYGNEIQGFFIDEPQISRNGIPWSFVLPNEYKKAYGEDLLPRLLELFTPIGDYIQTRYNFWRLIARLFSENFMKQIYDWCDERGLKLTGHMVLEESLESQLASNGAVMPNYEYFHIPGIDWLGRQINPPTTPLQVSSVAHQLGKKQVLSETFALTGWNVSFEELKWMYEWQMVRGITLLCPHLEGYSLRGIRKRDYPPSIFYQQPWWNEYTNFIEAMSRIGMVLSEGRVDYDTLLIHPQASAWVCYDDGENEGLQYYNDGFLKAISLLEGKHIQFHLGDEMILEKYAKVEGNTLVVGEQKYKTIVLPPFKILDQNTLTLIDEFKQNGGIVTDSESILPNDIIDNPNVTMTKRYMDDKTIYYFVNSTETEQNATICRGTYTLNILTGELEEFDNNYSFPPYGSLIVIDSNEEKRAVEVRELKSIALGGKWDVVHSDMNAITLDYCDYYFDGQLQEKYGYVGNIQGRACNLECPVDIDMQYEFFVNTVPNEVYLVLETPEIFSASINDRELKLNVCGYHLDSSFKKVNIGGMLKQGSNTISLRTKFEQSNEVYENLKKSRIFESEKNKLTYDMEIEFIYIVGDFGVLAKGEFTELERKAVRYKGDFELCTKPKQIEIKKIEQQGFPFFSGSISIFKKYIMEDTNYCIKFSELNATVFSIVVNGKKIRSLYWRPYFEDISNYLVKGENIIEITITNSLRNLLGPHHLECGESYSVSPMCFFKENNIWGKSPWNSDYCFVKFGINY